MLARDFLSAKSLGISEIDRQAAIEVLDMLESGELDFVALEQEDLLSARAFSRRTPSLCKPHAGGLNMGVWGDRDCASGQFAGCAGGWMERVKGRPLSERCKVRFDDLFFPWEHHPGLRCFGSRLMPERVAWALRSKLQTGHADWGSMP